MSSPAPLLSILIPTWNRVDEVVRAIVSVGSTTPVVEIIVVDNASPPEIYSSLQKKTGSMPQVKLYRNETNLGMVKNWNRCISLADGEWLGLLCSDDVYSEGAIARACKLLPKVPAPSLVIQAPEISEEQQCLAAGSDTVRDLVLPIASGNFWHRSISERIGGFDERFEYSADAEFWYRIAFHFPVVKVREPFARYTIHADNYMWSTWERDDFLQQTELLARTVQQYSAGKDGSRNESAENRIRMDLWNTVTTILTNTIISPGKGSLFRKYAVIAFRQADTVRKKKELAALMLKLFCARFKKNLKRFLGGRE